MSNPRIRPKKSFGQNFLINKRVIEKIINTCQLEDNDYVVEIGPGKGALTQLLVKQCAHVLAIEKDQDMVNILNEEVKEANLKIAHQDATKFDYNTIPVNAVIIGNLPYNVATGIIEKVLMQRNDFKAFFMTIQLEHAKRIAASPNSKDYGSLSCFVQYHAIPKMYFRIKNSNFFPVPKVESCFLSLKPHQKIPVSVKDKNKFFNFIQKSFQQRRKTIVNSFSQMAEKQKILEVLEELRINTKSRPENLSLEDYAQIYNKLSV